jgi:uncharacterized protein
MITMATPYLPGKFVWYEHVSNDAKRAQAFYAEVLGWKTLAMPMGAESYEMACFGDSPDTMVAGYTPPTHGEPAQWLAYVSVEDVDAAAKAAVANGGKIVDAPSDIPTVGRVARLADPHGAELGLLKSSDGDKPDVKEAPAGAFFWNELHTPDPKAALAFYEKVVGFTHKTMDSAGGAYHIIGRGGVDRGGVSSHMPGQTRTHWLPYVHVRDVDATIARVGGNGGKVQLGATDIPGIGRFGVFADPTGAVLAVMKPVPMPK